MGDRRKCQTYAASPAEPGGLPLMLGCCGQTGRYLLGLTVTRAVGRYERENCQMVQRPAFIRAAALKQFDFSAYFIDSLAQRDQRVPLFAGPIRSARLQKLNH